MAATTTFVHFRIAGDRLGLALEDVQEIARVTRITKVPRTPAMIRGLANIRGRVVTLLDAEVLYGGIEGAPPGDQGQAVVLAPPREHLALYTRSRLDIGRGREADTARAPATRTLERDRPPAGAMVLMGETVVHVIPAAEIASHCETETLKRYRRSL